MGVAERHLQALLGEARSRPEGQKGGWEGGGVTLPLGPIRAQGTLIKRPDCPIQGKGGNTNGS